MEILSNGRLTVPETRIFYSHESLLKWMFNTYTFGCSTSPGGSSARGFTFLPAPASLEVPTVPLVEFLHREAAERTAALPNPDTGNQAGNGFRAAGFPRG